MGLFDNLKNDVGNDLKSVEQKINTTEGRKWIRYCVYGIVILLFLMISSCMFRSCTTPRIVPKVVYSEPQQQPIIHQSSDSSNMLIGGMLGYAIGQRMSNGQVYNGNNQPTTIINNRTYYIKADGSKIEKDKVTTQASKSITYPTPVKVKAPGDVEAERQRVLMKQEEDKRNIINQRKASLVASQQARNQSNTSGFNKFSKSSGSINLTKKK